MDGVPAEPTADDVRTRLGAIVGTAHVLTDPDLTAGHLTDWTGAHTGRALAVVRPADTAQTAAVVRWCAGRGIAICPQGGNTGLVGGSVPPADGRPAVVLSTTRLTDLGPVDHDDRCIAAGAGVTLARLHDAAGRAGLAFGVDLAARDSATVGGLIATNAGGIHVIRYGSMRAQLLGIEAVLASGEVLRRWRPLRKDNVGYDLPGLLAGSEGTLAVITAALLRLVAAPARTAVAVAGVAGVDQARQVVAAVENAGLVPVAAELMTAAGVDLLTAHGMRRPLAEPAPYLVLVEAAGTGAEGLAQVLAGVDGLIDAAVEEGPAEALWAVREGHTEAIARASGTPVVKLDVSVPGGAVAELLDRVGALAGQAGGRLIPFGHLADGNLHVNVLDVPVPAAAGLTDAILRAVAGLGGSISAEHGVGRIKTPWLGLGRSDADVAVMRAVKSAFDPDGLLNPGVLFG